MQFLARFGVIVVGAWAVLRAARCNLFDTVWLQIVRDEHAVNSQLADGNNSRCNRVVLVRRTHLWRDW